MITPIHIMILTSLILVGFYAWAARDCAKEQGYYQPLLFFTIALIFYVVLIPWELSVKGEQQVMLHPFSLPIDERLYAAISIMGCCAVAAFYMGQRVGRQLCNRVIAPPPAPPSFSSGATLVVLLALFAVFSSSSIGFWYYYGRPSYLEASRLVYTHPAIPIANLNAGVSGALFVSYGYLRGGRPGKVLSVLVGLVLACLSLLFSVKTPLILAGLSAVYLITRRFHGHALIAVFIFVAMLMTVPMLLLFSMLRPGIKNITRLPELLGKILPNFSLMNSEQGGSFFTLAHSLYNTDQLRYGATYLSDLSLFIPRFLWPGRPLSVAEQFASALVNIKDGRGFSFSPFTEAYINFGILGALPHFFVFGMVIAGFAGLLRWMQGRGYVDALLADIILKVVGFFLVVMFFRYYFMGWIKMSLIMLAIPMLALVITHILKRKYAPTP